MLSLGISTGTSAACAINTQSALFAPAAASAIATQTDVADKLAPAAPITPITPIPPPAPITPTPGHFASLSADGVRRTLAALDTRPAARPPDYGMLWTDTIDDADRRAVAVIHRTTIERAPQ
ncbi:hypothetical protein C7399_106108 [Paraburkholderia tropica]|uniref:Uncharacterized protein n=1 Tax=Paraburkholderia tropica TaxID=92647 RepID=A0ABX5MR31_9BURK|nr:hypothetical protein C7400_106108 [Paraburkholderia tropica]PZW84573.1 hypothetical protein C7399_106108 [Paraburkholderia tropica]